MNIEIGKYINSTIPISRSGMPVYVGLPRKGRGKLCATFVNCGITMPFRSLYFCWLVHLSSIFVAFLIRLLTFRFLYFSHTPKNNNKHKHKSPRLQYKKISKQNTQRSHSTRKIHRKGRKENEELCPLFPAVPSSAPTRKQPAITHLIAHSWNLIWPSWQS